MKKKIIAAVAILLVLGLAAGGGMIYKQVRLDSAAVEVMPVSSVNDSWYGENTETYGYVTTDISQDIYLSDSQLIQEIYVKEGDHVKVGDDLMAYDMTLVDIEYEMEMLNQQVIDIRLEAANHDLAKLRKEKPISSSAWIVPADNSVLVASPADEEEEETKEETDDTDTPEPPPQSESETEPQSESETPGETEAPVLELYEVLDAKSKPLKGTGTAKDPYIFQCVDKVVIKGAFFNLMKGYDAAGKVELNEGSYFVVELYDVETENLIVSWKVKPLMISLQEEDAEFVLDSETILYPNETDDLGFEDWGGIYGGSIEEGYTKEELATAIYEKETLIRELELQKKESILKSDSIRKQLEDQTIKSTVNGVVKKVGDPEVGAEQDGSAFLTVTSEDGFYVKGSISELYLDEVEVGSQIMGQSWESGLDFTAEITEISQYPQNSQNYSEQNASQYSFVALIDDPGSMKNYENVGITIINDEEMDTSSLYFYKAYVREENGKYFVYIADEDDRLKKQYVEAKAVNSYWIQVKGGVSLDDRIAFPYGKNVKEGAKVKEIDESSLTYFY